MGRKTHYNLKDREVLAKISLLKDIEPRKEWVILAKNRILAEKAPAFTYGVGQRLFQPILDVFSVFRYLERPMIIIPVLSVLIFAGILVQTSQNSFPGDPLYALKAVTEKIQMRFSPEDNEALMHLELAQRRLEDLKKVAEGNKVKNLPSTIKEFESNVAGASKGLTALVEKQPSKALQVTHEIVKLQEEKSRVEQILGVKISEKESGELENLTKELIENELADLRTRSLTEAQSVLLKEAEQAFQEGDYETSLEKILILSNNR